MKSEKLKKIMEYFLWGETTRKHSLRRQMARVITICCIMTVTVQAVVMLAIILNQYVSQEKTDTLSLLEGDNVKMDNAIRYLEEMVLSIQHNAGVRSFLTLESYSGQSAQEELKTVANLFSERNRSSAQEPLVERIYLLRDSGESVHTLYYPTLVSETEEYEVKYTQMRERFLKQSGAFYFEVFVRGNWANSKESCPMILAKCCHDFDILLYLIEKKCRRVSSFGSLSHFRPEYAPADAPLRSTDNCPHKDTCPYFAPRFYQSHPRAVADGFRGVVTMEESNEALLQALRTGPYGRCVYRCGNDVVDHQVVNLEFEGGITASLTMSAFTHLCQRTITLQGTRGELQGNMEENRIRVVDFVTGNETVYCLNTSAAGHSGSDSSMMREITGLIASGRQSQSVSKALEAIDSHLIAFAAEESRLQGGKVIEL